MRSNSLGSKGQALLLVIAAMTVALALGINVSTRTLQSVSRTSRTDTSERILAAAEGGLERALKLSPGVLNGGISGPECAANMGGSGTLNALGECVLSFTIAGDPIVAQAAVAASSYSYTNAPNILKFKVEQDSVTEVPVVSGNSFQLCWKPTAKSDLYYIIYSNTAILAKNILRALPASYSPPGPYIPHGSENAVNAGGGKSCKSSNISVPAGAVGLRIRSIGGDSKVEITGTLPTQGYKIVSKGSLTGDIAVTKVITVYKSLPYLPSIFDFAIFTQGSVLNYP